MDHYGPGAIQRGKQEEPHDWDLRPGFIDCRTPTGVAVAEKLGKERRDAPCNGGYSISDELRPCTGQSVRYRVSNGDRDREQGKPKGENVRQFRESVPLRCRVVHDISFPLPSLLLILCRCLVSNVLSWG